MVFYTRVDNWDPELVSLPVSSWNWLENFSRGAERDSRSRVTPRHQFFWILFFPFLPIIDFII